jgi:acetyl esterase/lipase
MEHPEPDTRTLERGLGEYVRAVAAAVGVPDESTTVEISDTATAYLGLPRRWRDRPDHDVMLVWSELRGWSLAVETDPAEDPVVIARHGGGDLVPSPRTVAQFVADTVAGHHTAHESPGPATAATRKSLAERLKPYLDHAQ